MSETFDIDPSDFTGVPNELEDSPSSDGKVSCPDCGGRYTVTKAGSIRSHNCNGVRTVSRTGTKSTSKRGGKKSNSVPANVLKLGSPALASGIEWSAKRLVAQAVPCDPSEVPADIPDDDLHVMVDPLIRLLWPNIPAKAQSIVESICDQEDLILCALAWVEYGQKLSAWTKEQHKLYVAAQKQNEVTNGISTAGNGSTDFIRNGVIRPIQPITPSEEAM